MPQLQDLLYAGCVFLDLLIWTAEARNVVDGFRSARGGTGCSYENGVTIESWVKGFDVQRAQIAVEGSL
jgi:hypothetical protein